MTAPLSAERVKELRLRIEHLQYLFSADRVDLDAILSSYSSLRAENERLREQHKTDEGVNLRLCEMHTNQQKELHNLGKAYKKAEAEVKRLKKAIDETGRLDTERIQTVARRKP